MRDEEKRNPKLSSLIPALGGTDLWITVSTALSSTELIPSNVAP
jgi:hypothetical protein